MCGNAIDRSSSSYLALAYGRQSFAALILRCPYTRNATHSLVVLTTWGIRRKMLYEVHNGEKEKKEEDEMEEEE